MEPDKPENRKVSVDMVDDDNLYEVEANGNTT